MMSTTRQPPSRAAAPIDPAQARCVSRMWVEARQLTHYTIEYPARSAVAGNGWYEVVGWSDGTGATCTCPGFAYRQRCRHAAAFPLMLEAVEQAYQATKTTADLIACLDFWSVQREPLTVDQRLAQNAQRAILAARGVRHTDAIPLAARLAIVARGKDAARELAGT